MDRTPPSDRPISYRSGEPVVLTAALQDRIKPAGTVRRFAAGEVLVAVGERDYPFELLLSGRAAVVREATLDQPEQLLRVWGPGEFAGEWGLITGQSSFLTIRGIDAGEVLEVPRDRLMALLTGDVDLSNVILREFLRRREILRRGPGASSVEILGTAASATVHDLRSWADRQRIPFTFLDIAEAAGAGLMDVLGCSAEDLPVVLTPTATIRDATVGKLSENLGLSYRATGGVNDLVVIGGGPAGLAAAVYGASEGLSTLLLDGVSVGGQAAASSRIENFLGFPGGVSGGDLMTRGLIQAQKFGATVSTPCAVVSLRPAGELLELELTDGTGITSRAAVIATGVSYRRLPLERWQQFEGAGIFFAATEIEAQACSGNPVVVVGGANSAGQAAMFLASRGSPVHLVVRGEDLGAGMSDYLVRRVRAQPEITIRLQTEVTGLHGEAALTGVDLTDRVNQTVEQQACGGLFCFIGATAATRWLDGVALDGNGFVRTDSDLDGDDLSPVWAELGRLPLPFETSLPRVFAAGDVRSASMKRVAAAVGEGSSVIPSVHRAIGVVL